MASSAKERNQEKDLTAGLELLMREGEKTLDPLAKLIPMEMLWANESEAEGVLHVEDKVLNPFGFVHGGILSTLADSVAGHNMVAAGKICVTQSSTLTFLRPARGPKVFCRSRVQKLGRQIGVCTVEMADGEGSLLVTGLFTFSVIKEIEKAPH